MSADGSKIELGNVVHSWEEGEGRIVCVEPLLGAHFVFFVFFLINLCHSDSALITTRTMIAIHRQAFILLMILLYRVII